MFNPFVQQVPLEHLGPALALIMANAARYNKTFLNQQCQDLAFRFEQRAKDEYFESGLRVRTGRLRASTQGFIRHEGDSYLIGLRNPMPYARIQEFGGRPAGFRESIASLSRRATRAGTSRAGYGYIRAHFFLSDPIKREAYTFSGRLMQGIGL